MSATYTASRPPHRQHNYCLNCSIWWGHTHKHLQTKHSSSGFLDFSFHNKCWKLHYDYRHLTGVMPETNLLHTRKGCFFGRLCGVCATCFLFGWCTCHDWLSVVLSSGLLVVTICVIFLHGSSECHLPTVSHNSHLPQWMNCQQKRFDWLTLLVNKRNNKSA